ncbi:MAG: ATP-binding cassette domain-containing protein, partial [Alphaproteobacteria bacterium]|nr:ATP-binding cassette domain-containing protein [Alphaproteobacteria bacterium]
AIADAQLAETVAGLPQGLETQVGERGVRLSGGQRQRVAIARALYGGPEVLVFDEATSALDNQTEAEIVRAIGRLSGSRTVLIIAHRLSTVKSCDRLVFLKGGRVLDQGTFDELMARNAEFRAMATAAEAP